jgi:hypothetical protein
MANQGFLKDFDTCQFMTDAVDQISDIIFICEIYGKRQVKQLPGFSQAKLLGDKILEKIPPLFAIVLQFSYETRKLVLGHGKIGTCFLPSCDPLIASTRIQLREQYC